MKKALIVLSVLAALAAPAWAGGIGPMVAYWDTSEAGDDNGLGFKVGFDLGSNIDFDLRVSFFDSFANVQQGRLFALEATPIDVGFSYGFNPSGAVNPYLGGGLSYVLFKAEVVNRADQTRVSDEPGWYAVGGLEAPIGGHFRIFGEVLYRQVKAQVEGDDIQTFVKADIDFAGPGANAGILFSW